MKGRLVNMASTTGVFPAYAMDMKILTATDTYSTVKDLEEITCSIDTGVEEWNSMSEEGWRRALATSKALTLDCKGKRCWGDTGNDYVAGLWNKSGKDCETSVQLTFPNGDSLTMDVVVQVTAAFGGSATGIQPLEFSLMSNGEPVYTEAA